MSNLYQNVLAQMFNNYHLTKPVESVSCQEKFKCDTQCLSDMFRVHKQRTYACNTITAMYVLRFCNRYSSEVYHILNDKMPKLSSGDIIFSIGCGSCMETIGIERYCRDNNILDVKYEGYDYNSKWQNIAKVCCVSSPHLISSNPQILQKQTFIQKLPQIKVLLLNYMLSDLKNHQPSLSAYLSNNLAGCLQIMKHDSYIIVNDQNHSNEWEAEFDGWSTKLNITQYKVNNYFFDPGWPAPCNPRGIRMSNNSLIFSNNGLDLSISNYFQANLACCESGVTIIHKL